MIVRNYMMQGGYKYDPDPWIDKMLISYDTINSHFDAPSKAAYLPVLQARLQPTYVDSVATGYLYTTFGPAGQNKTVCDFVYLFNSLSSSYTARTNAKSGATLRWNQDGTITVQNNLPAYTRGANPGFITCSSTDGWNNLTQFQLNSIDLENACPLLTGTTLNLLRLDINNLKRFPLFSLPLLKTFYIYTNTLNTEVNLKNHNIPTIFDYIAIGSNYESLDGYLFLNTGLSNCNFSGNKMPISVINTILSTFNTYFSTHTPIKNLTLNLSGTLMGIPTGGASNTDLLGILASYTAAGYVATIVIRTL
jgi:hypothetical protein